MPESFEFFYSGNLKCKKCGLCVKEEGKYYCQGLNKELIKDPSSKLSRCPAFLAEDETYQCELCDDDIIFKREEALDKIDEEFRKWKKFMKEHPETEPKTRADIARELNVTVPKLPEHRGLRVHITGSHAKSILCPKCFIKEYKS